MKLFSNQAQDGNNTIVVISKMSTCSPSDNQMSWNFLRSQYKNRLFTIIILGRLNHFSFITTCKHSSTPSSSLLPLMSIAMTEGDPPFRVCVHNVFKEAISSGLSTLQSANLHSGNLCRDKYHQKLLPSISNLFHFFH